MSPAAAAGGARDRFATGALQNDCRDAAQADVPCGWQVLAFHLQSVPRCAHILVECPAPPYYLPVPVAPTLREHGIRRGTIQWSDQAPRPARPPHADRCGCGLRLR